MMTITTTKMEGCDEMMTIVATVLCELSGIALRGTAPSISSGERLLHCQTAESCALQSVSTSRRSFTNSPRSLLRWVWTLACVTHILLKGPAKRGHIKAATLLTRACFANVDSFCQARSICGGNKFCVLDTKKFRNISYVRAWCAAMFAAFCQGLNRATPKRDQLQVSPAGSPEI